MTKILDLNSKEDAKKKIVQLKKEIDKLQAIVDKKDTLFDRIKTYKDVCKELKEKESICPYTKLKQIEKLFNGSWIKDWTNRNQQKWYPYFDFDSPGGLVFYGSDSRYCFSNGGVAFYKDRETSDYVGKTFINEYLDVIK